ncbi:MAG: hypothetical protein Q9167_003546 [Letrouitia subvulpina]
MPKKFNKGSNSSASFAEKYSYVPQNESNMNTPFHFDKRADELQKNVWISNGRYTHENPEETELRHFRRIHVAPDLAALGFKARSPRSMSHLSPNRQLLSIITRPLDPLDQVEGWIYVFQRKDVFGLFKVGYTFHRVDQSNRCRQSQQILYQRQVRNVIRVEALIGVELAEHRRVEEVCNPVNGCFYKHWEWLALSPHKLVAIIERWAQWMDSEPYNAEDTLDDRWLEQVEAQVSQEPQVE